MRSRTLAVLAAGLTAIGCAGNFQTDERGTSGVAESSDARPVTTTQSPAPAPADESTGGAMIASYSDAQSSEAINGRALLKDDHMLERLADKINQTLILPYDIWLRGSQCGEANAIWNGSAHTLTICYEGVDTDQRIFAEAGDPDSRRSALNSAYAKFYHEVAHMATSIYRLPIAESEEDAADQLAAYMLLAPRNDGRVDPESVQAVKDLALTLGATRTQTPEAGEDNPTDIHSLNEVRMRNLECWIYGSDPVANANLVTDGQLPKERASGCQREWEQLEQLWSALLEPHLKRR